MAFKLPELPYSFDALEPHIDARTMEIHYTKHHQAYIDKLNAALEKYPDLQKKSVNELLADIESTPSDIRQAVTNHGGGHANHSFFWEILSPAGSEAAKAGKPKAELAKAIDETFGNFDEFKKQFTEKAMGVFGSGWAFLIVTKDKKLALKRHSFQNSPLMRGNTPILGLDVWEHAYYIQYNWQRAEYVKNWWNIINWEQVEKNYTLGI